MTIIDRARDALKKLNNPMSGSIEKDHSLLSLENHARDYAAEVVRLHDQFAALADELKAQGERLGKSTYVHERAEGAGYAAAAARIREVLEGDK